MSEERIINIEKKLSVIETKQDIILERMPDKGSIIERLKIHSYLITVLFGGIVGIAFFIIRKTLTQ